MKQLASIFLLYSLTSCITWVNTRQSLHSRAPSFQKDDVFIMDKVKGLTHNRSAQLYDWAKQKGESRLQKPLLYLPSKEYELLGKGLKKEQLAMNELSDTAKQLIHAHTGATYLLRVDVLGRYTDDRYSNTYNLEVTDKNESYAILRFHVIHLTNDTYSYSFRIKTTKTTVSFIGIEPSGLSGALFATSRAFSKGWKKILRGFQ